MRAMGVRPANRFRALPVLLLIAAATLGIGCNEKSTKPKDVPTGPSLRNPQEVLDNLLRSWVDFDYDTYQALLSNDFVFAFAPQDTGGVNHYPGTWGRTDDLLSTSHLFGQSANGDGYVAERATLTFVRGPEIPNDMGTWTKVVLSQVFLTVSTRHHTTGDPLDYLVQGDQANLWFVQEGDKWKIIRWEDKPILPLATQPSTFGLIKRLYR